MNLNCHCHASHEYTELHGKRERHQSTSISSPVLESWFTNIWTLLAIHWIRTKSLAVPIKQSGAFLVESSQSDISFFGTFFHPTPESGTSLRLLSLWRGGCKGLHDVLREKYKIHPHDSSDNNTNAQPKAGCEFWRFIYLYIYFNTSVW